PEGGKLQVATERDDDSVVITIEDTGGGIAREDLDSIFEPMFTTKLGRGGTGLGLTIVRQIVLEHGGEITVVSERGRGTRFTISLPLLARDKEAVSVTDISGKPYETNLSHR